MIKTSLIIVLTIFCTNLEAARKTYGDLEVSRLIKVIDGDTIKVEIKSIHPILGESRSVRVYGVDTPEMNKRNVSKEERERERVRALVAKGFVISELEGKKILLKDVGLDNFSRILSEVLYKPKNCTIGKFGKYKNLTKELLKRGLGVEYYGGKRK